MVYKHLMLSIFGGDPVRQMSCQRLIDNFRQHIPLLPEEEQLICSLFSPRSFRKGQMINTEGEINRYTNFITQGSARVYYLDHSGQEHVIQLAIAGWWIGDYPSFITQQPGHLFTQALQQTEVLSLSYDNQQLLYERIPKTERFFRLLTQRAYVAFQKRMLQNLSMDAEGRYRTFRETYPDMDQQISQKHIASYLGMSAEFLSKIKKRMLKKSKPGQI